MRTNFSPTAAAARRFASCATTPKVSGDSTPPMEPRWCEWPRPVQPVSRTGSIWQALRQIQTRHA